MRALDARIPTSYASAAAILGPKARQRVAANTEIVRTTDHSIGVSLHGTVVVAFEDTGKIALNSGGYRTATTKARINSALRETHFRVAQKAGRWIVWSMFGGTVGAFHDGMTVKA